MTNDKKPKPPTSLKAAGGRLWRSVIDAYALEEHESALLLEACRVADRLDDLDVLVRRDGLLDESSQGRRAHPALVESRQQAVVLARILAALRLPDEDAGEDRRPQRRSGVRGVYGVGPRGVA